MPNLLNLSVWTSAGLIFLLRVGDMSLDTMRVLFVMRGRKAVAWILGFFQASIFVIAISSVLSHLDNPLNILGYAAGFATGNVVGMWIEGRLAVGHVQLSIVSSHLGAASRRPDALGGLRHHRDPRPGQGRRGNFAELQRFAQESIHRPQAGQ